MKFSYSLLKKFVPRLPAASKTADLLTMHSFEVESVKGDVIDVKLYANRYSDASSHIGIARELAAALGKPLKSPLSRAVNAPKGKGLVSVQIEEKALCPRYAARVFDVPAKKRPLPAWIKKTLASCGVQSINPVVDIMNFVMLETGQPLHAFDFAKIESTGSKAKNQKSKLILVRKAKKGEKLTTLDGKELTLEASDLIIADRERALALAGIKGGKESGVTAKTTRIIVEAANFEPTGIFRTSRRIGLLTDAAVRFSHGMSPALVVDYGLDRASVLLKDLLGARLLDSADVNYARTTDAVIAFDPEHYMRLVGASVNVREAANILQSLGFSVEKQRAKGKAGFLVRVPAWRTDVTMPEDLIEEVVRVRGLEHISPSPPRVSLGHAHEDETIGAKTRIRELLVRYGFDEVYTSSFVPDSVKEGVPLANPLSSDLAHLRPDLSHGIRATLLANRRFFDEVKTFEIGAVFAPGGPRGVHEELHLGFGIARKKGSGFFELKGACDDLLRGLGIADISFAPVGDVLRVESGDHVLGLLHDEDLGKGWTASLAELNMAQIAEVALGEREYRPLPKYPPVMRDISILVVEETRIGEVLSAIQTASPALVMDADLIDQYSGDQMEGKQSLTFRIVFQSDERTLTDAEVNSELQKILVALRRDFRAVVR